MITPKSNEPRLTGLEEQAYRDTISNFAGHLNQFPVSQKAISKLEQNLTTTALTLNCAVAGESSRDIVMTSNDGKWHKSIMLFDNIGACHRRDGMHVEYAVVEQLPNGENEVWAKGPNAAELLKLFVSEERQTMKVWNDDLVAQVKEFLGQRFPGQDMTNVSERVIRSVSQADNLNQQADRRRGMKI